MDELELKITGDSDGKLEIPISLLSGHNLVLGKDTVIKIHVIIDSISESACRDIARAIAKMSTTPVYRNGGL